MLPILYKIIVYVIASVSGDKKPLPTEESRIKKKTEWRHRQVITTLGRQWQESKAIYSWVVSLRTTWRA